MSRLRGGALPWWRHAVPVALALMVVGGSGWPTWRVVAATRAAAPPGLPAFGIGVAAQPDPTGLYGWMPDSGVPWSYAYQYLAGGVNTNSGWETWNASAQFPLFYATGAGARGYVPVFPYYELLQSTGTCSGCGDAQKDLANLNNSRALC